MHLPGPPPVEELPKQAHGVLNEEFQITCTATNDHHAPSNLMFSWEAPRGIESNYTKLNYTKLNYTKLNYTTTDEDDKRVASSTLHFSNVTLDRGGMYTCRVRNRVGEGLNVDTMFTLIVEGAI